MNRKQKEEALVAFLTGDYSRVNQIMEANKPPLIVQGDETQQGDYLKVSVRTAGNNSSGKELEAHDKLTKAEFDSLLSRAKKKGHPSILLFTDNSLHS
ncbi:hypothetical protein [Siphonobacter sp.]|uniref:hypothetical protein n=1 Tax=Siphonobacter sp. TaxID=1869184 RepID=UPI003B3B1AB7